MIDEQTTGTGEVAGDSATGWIRRSEFIASWRASHRIDSHWSIGQAAHSTLRLLGFSHLGVACCWYECMRRRRRTYVR
jgi:hypothetical protein